VSLGLSTPDAEPGRRPRKKDFNKKGFKAGMYMKTNNSKTNFPKTNGHLCLRFGHFCLTKADSAEIRGESTMKRRNLPSQSLAAAAPMLVA
jgi:hypothetical protein